MPTRPTTHPNLPTLPLELRLKIYALTLPHSLRLRYKHHRRTQHNRNWRKISTTAHLTPLTSFVISSVSAPTKTDNPTSTKAAVLPTHNNVNRTHSEKDENENENRNISLLLTSRALNIEATPLFYSTNTFILEIPRHSFTATLRRHAVLACMRSIEIRNVNFGRGSVWYRGQLERVFGREILLEGLDEIGVDGNKGKRGEGNGQGSQMKGGCGEMALAALREVTFRLEGEDSFRDSKVKGMVGRFLARAAMLEKVDVFCQQDKGTAMVGCVSEALGKGWARSAQFGVLPTMSTLGMHISWKKRRSGGKVVALRGI